MSLMTIRWAHLSPISALLLAITSAHAAPVGDYQGWLWETGVTNVEQDEEFCFSRIDFSFATGIWTAGTTNEVCAGRTTTANGRTLFNPPPFTPSSNSDRSTRPLVSAGGNLYEVFGEELIGSDGQGEERFGTLLATPTDDNLLMLGGYEANDLAGREYFSYVDLFAKSTPAIRDARVADNLIGTWRIASYGRLLEQIDRETTEATIHSVNLSTGGACSFVLSGILAADGFTGNADVFSARHSDDGINFSDRGLKFDVAKQNSSLCTYLIDGNGYLAIAHTVDGSPGTIRFVVADNNNFLVHAPNGGGLPDNSEDLAVGYRAATGMTVDEIDGTFLFYLPLNAYDASGTEHSTGQTDVQELDGFGRGKLILNSAQVGIAPPGEPGLWFGCDMELLLNDEDRVLSGVASDGTVSISSFTSAEDFGFDSCDYSADADGGLRVHATFIEPDGTTDIMLRGYVDNTRELFSLISIDFVTAANGKQDSAELRFALGIRYNGDPTADADGDGFSNYQEFKIPLALAAARGDLDGDGASDILWRNTGTAQNGTGQNWAYLMNGATITTSAGINTVSDLNWTIVGHGDYDGNGTSDILWRNTSTGQNWMYLMSGTTIASSVGVNTVPTAWEIVGSGDLDGNGTADILWRNSLTGQNWAYLMSGATIATSAGVNTVSDTAWTVAGTGDYDGNGTADILWRNTSTGQNWMYLMNGTTISSSVGVNTVPAAWEIAGSGDLDGNGTADILWRNSLTGQNWAYLMSGATIATSAGINTVSDTAWTVAGSGDYDGNGTADILWRNTSTGQNWAYLMSGTTITSSVGVNTAPTDWEIVNTN